jgi:hypothetical protein
MSGWRGTCGFRFQAEGQWLVVVLGSFRLKAEAAVR